MIARFVVPLPFDLYVAEGYKPVAYKYMADEYQFIVYPPMFADDEPIDENSFAREIDRQLWATELISPLKYSGKVFVNGKPAALVNRFIIDFVKPEFDRRTNSGSGPRIEAPLVELCFSTLNSILTRLRAVTGAAQIRPLNPNETRFVIHYVNDDLSPLEQHQGLARQRFRATWNLQFASLTETIWQEVHKLPMDYEPQVWRTLLLDATAMLPEVGASIVLTFAALETLIAKCIDVLAAQTVVPRDLWLCFTNPSDFRKAPSTSDEFSDLLKLITAAGPRGIGRSLKDDMRLWKGFVGLKNARNTFVHEGIARIAESNNRPATKDDALNYIRIANDIADWVESLMPESFRRPQTSDKPVVAFDIG